MMTKLRVFAAAAAMAGTSMTVATPAQAQAEPLLGQLMVFGGNFCPRGWMRTDGQLLAIANYSALFSILGTTFGGDGRTTFALPDLRGRVSFNVGQGPGLPEYRLGQKGGADDVTLTVIQLPSHSHSASLRASDGPPNSDNPAGNVLADFPATQPIYSSAAPNVNMNPSAILVGNSGGNQSFDNRQPYIAMTYCIAIQGIFPSRG